MLLAMLVCSSVGRNQQRGWPSVRGAPFLSKGRHFKGNNLTHFSECIPQARHYWEKAWVTGTGKFRNHKSEESSNFEGPITCQQFAFISNQSSETHNKCEQWFYMKYQSTPCPYCLSLAHFSNPRRRKLQTGRPPCPADSPRQCLQPAADGTL